MQESKQPGLLEGLAKIKTGAASVWKLALIALLMALLLIPVGMIKDLITERDGSRSEAEREVSKKWGESQQVAGPILTVPYRTYVKDDKGQVDTILNYAHFLPEALRINGKLDPEIRHRGIFDVALFKADLDLQGKFPQPDFSAWKVNPQDVVWEEAFLTISVPDVRSLADALPLQWQGEAHAFAPDNFQGSPVTSGLQAHVIVDKVSPKDGAYTFQFHLRLNGSGSMNFLPMGKETHIGITSGWKTPSFTGAFLPLENSLTDKGFSAQWKTLHLSRSFPQSWKNWDVTQKDWDAYSFGVELLLPVDHYQKTMRCAKYAALFILLTFSVFFLYEIFDRTRIHPLQYLLVGFALCLFYLLLLALTEHLDFNFAYAVAATATVGLITAYGTAIFSAKKKALGLGAMLAGLYGYLFTLLGMEDYALLMGALGLFAILCAVMFLTRRIDWYGGKEVPEVKV